MICMNDITLTLDRRKILDKVSLHIQAGETAVILGPSGAGKSTILRAILGLWKPEAGSIFVDRVRISSLNEKQMLAMRKNMAMVFQNNALFDSLTVEENVSYFLKEQNNLSKNMVKKRANDALSFVNLNDAEALYPGELSGGMKKRVAIARAIVSAPEVLFADEPTGNLDSARGREVMELLTDFNLDRGITIVMVTHEPDMARYAKRTIRFLDGLIIADGKEEIS